MNAHLPTLANVRDLPGYRETYTVSSACPSTVHGWPSGYVTDALSGRTTALYHVGGKLHRVPLDTPLCEGCDHPIEDGPCGCMVRA